MRHRRGERERSWCPHVKLGEHSPSPQGVGPPAVVGALPHSLLELTKSDTVGMEGGLQGCRASQLGKSHGGPSR